MRGGVHECSRCERVACGALVTSATLLGQFERALNRLYGVEQDRPSLRKYAHALRLSLTAVTLGVVPFALPPLLRLLDTGASPATWTVAWPLLPVPRP